MSAADIVHLRELIHSLEHTVVTRYLSAAGFIVLSYDHFLTLGDEIKLIWHAPRSLLKFGFLFNRYLVLICLFALTCEMSGFGVTFTDAFTFTLSMLGKNRCRIFLFAMSMLGIITVGMANILVLLRVVLLWERRPFVLRMMSFGFVSSFTVQIVCMVLANYRLRPSIEWSPIAKMCVVTQHTALYVAVWVAPMLFEILVIVFSVANALDRPRTVRTHIGSALHNDGVTYFVALTALRIINLALAATGNPSLALLAVFFIWSMTTTILCRSLLGLREAELSQVSHSRSVLPSPRSHGIHVVDMDHLTFWQISRKENVHDMDIGHRPSASVGSSTKLLRLGSVSRKDASLDDDDWDPHV
ncbi:hypothetical protein BXZ70DRAFT_1012619 [Cristinia sonorae]|uniref:DUF6533 domain-containing protein n=1 Tax=Cristinia sonorae TaxID=1940300 RepID=A0A8K0UG49_9AGAR|nr:hypothetical protein BXZ70DRAFT_1012619 [Cristinia sonorae]